MFAKQILLTNDHPKREFEFSYSFSCLTIASIEATSLLQLTPQEWYPKLSRLFLLFTYSDQNNKTTSFPLDLSSQTQLNQWKPEIFFTDFIIPEENKNNVTSRENFINHLSIELKSYDSILADTKIALFYQETPGVKLNELKQRS